MAANTSVAIPTDRASGTTPEARFFVSETRYARLRPPSSNTGVILTFTPRTLPSTGAENGRFFFGFFLSAKS